MTWQEYQESVVLLYEQLEGVGTVLRNQQIPDKITGQRRQVDAMLTIDTKGHSITFLIDAKFYSDPIDVKVVEEVVALATAVGANKSIIVTSNGWTAPAEKKAVNLSCDLRLFSLESALEVLVPDTWMLCPSCNHDCIVMDKENIIGGPSGGWIWWLGGACRECRAVVIQCQDCGEEILLEKAQSYVCSCNYKWTNDDGRLGFSIEQELE